MGKLIGGIKILYNHIQYIHTDTELYRQSDTDTHACTLDSHFISFAFLRKCRNKTKKSLLHYLNNVNTYEYRNLFYNHY